MLVACNKSSILLPVTPTTTPMDLIRSASTCLSEPIDPKASVLLESFGKVGVQRPLRMYEHVRDVMNSWDDDKQNSLVLVESATGGVDEDLDAAKVPVERPVEISFTVYHSQKPGKWDKRWVALRCDGQMVLAKHEGAKDVTNVCHLSDFDIYTPTPKQVARKIKPPKKICFAIKSQQKSSMFITTSSFVHFFCTNDRDVGANFYKAVQGWRSWYLVNVMGEGSRAPAAKSDDVPAGRHVAGQQRDVERTKATNQHMRGASVESHYQLGSFKPLLDMDQFDKKLDEQQSQPSGPNAAHRRNMSMQSKTKPPCSYPSKLPQDIDTTRHSGRRRPSASQTQDSPTQDEPTFSPTGLLGRTYSQRQRAQEERDAAAKSTGPFTAGPSLIRDIADPTIPPTIPRSSLDRDQPTRPQRRTSVRSTTRTSTDKPPLAGPASTRRDLPRPLVDLTPQYREPPQHQRKGKAFVPDQVGPGGLIDCATSPDTPFAIPPATDWRARPRTSTGASAPSAGYRPPTSAGAGVAATAAPPAVPVPVPVVHHDPTTRTRSLRGGPQHKPAPMIDGAVNRHGDAPAAWLESSEAFTGGGLLARAGPSQGGLATGKGVMTGANAKGPMLDVTEKSKFVPGSLLAGVERSRGPVGPVIDREDAG